MTGPLHRIGRHLLVDLDGPPLDHRHEMPTLREIADQALADAGYVLVPATGALLRDPLEHPHPMTAVLRAVAPLVEALARQAVAAELAARSVAARAAGAGAGDEADLFTVRAETFTEATAVALGEDTPLYSDTREV